MKYLLSALAVTTLLLIGGYAVLSPLPGTTARMASGDIQHTERDGRAIRFYVQGSGPRVILLASAGREASDFNELAASLVSAGYRTLAVEAPGIDGSDLGDGEFTLYDLADDVAAAVRADAAFDHPSDGDARTGNVVIGHAFGNRVARALGTRHDELVSAVITLAAGGQRPIPPKAAEALRNCFNPARPAAARLEDIRYGFFSGDNDIPDYWRRGWHAQTAIMQGKASPMTPDTDWHSAGGNPLLVVQAEDDTIAPKEDTADLLAAEFGDRVEVVVIGNAGHALLPEQPDAIADAVLDFLSRTHPLR